MADRMEAITSLAKRRGFAFPSSEIYGGLRSSWDYGPLGVELKRNVRNAWWRSMVQLRDDVVGLESSIIMSPVVWEASGHAANFNDPMVDDREILFEAIRDFQKRSRRFGGILDDGAD